MEANLSICEQHNNIFCWNILHVGSFWGRLCCSTMLCGALSLALHSMSSYSEFICVKALGIMANLGF